MVSDGFSVRRGGRAPLRVQGDDCFDNPPGYEGPARMPDAQLHALESALFYLSGHTCPNCRETGTFTKMIPQAPCNNCEWRPMPRGEYFQLAFDALDTLRKA